MVCPRQPYSVLMHSLLSCGAELDRVHLAMFTVYIDDSGTDPKQRVAIAAGLIFPALRIKALEQEWNNFKSRYGFTDFHSSECVAHNPHSEFALWDDTKTSNVFRRARQIIRKYAVKGCCVGIQKETYDKVLPDELREIIGKSHYTLAVDHVCGFIRNWALSRNVPLEYVFDETGKAQKREIELVMDNGDTLWPGQFRYMFRKRKELPTLQSADNFAWTCYQQSLQRIYAKPLTPIANESWEAFSNWGDENWCDAWFATEPSLREWVQRIYADKTELERLRGLLAKRKKRS